jgi:hypothetical protein
MVDDVWPLAPGTRVRLGTFNGIGCGFKGFTRTDPQGSCFATHWFMVVYLPLIPLGRYYLTQGGTTDENYGFYSHSVTRYTIHGRSRLRATEILCTYVYQWVLAPAFVIVPIVLWLNHADQISGETSDDVSGWRIALLIGVFLIWLLGSIFALAFLMLKYRRSWAPLRSPRMRHRRSR